MLNTNLLNPFQVDVPLLYALKTLENLYFEVFKGYRKGT